MRRDAFASLLLVSATLACDETSPDPIGEVVVQVDTDLPVPAFVSRLRVDFYTESGRWYETRDVSLADPRVWPTSFGVFVDDAAESIALVRLRAYPEGGVRDYRGERFAERPKMPLDDALALVDPSRPSNGTPRLVDKTGKDITPRFEPQPLLTVDRLIRVRVRAGERLTAHVVLRGACVGTMADVVGKRTCVDREDALVEPVVAPLDDDRAPRPSLAGSFAPSEKCTKTPRSGTTLPDGTRLFDEQACVDGAMFRLGAHDGVFGHLEDLPERVAILDPFLIERYEVTVARYRKALADGFVSPDATPTVNDADLAKDEADFQQTGLCSWSTTPRGREMLALTCISHEAAIALCRFFGGDLPSEAQWEYAATIAGRPFRTRFAWGGPDDTIPGCERAIWGRGATNFTGQVCNTTFGFGPAPVNAAEKEGGDVTPGLAIVNLGAGVAEWARDTMAPLDAACWLASGLRDPGCFGVPGQKSVRGGGWRDNVASLIAANRRREDEWSTGIGFRCVYRGTR